MVLGMISYVVGQFGVQCASMITEVIHSNTVSRNMVEVSCILYFRYGVFSTFDMEFQIMKCTTFSLFLAESCSCLAA